MVGSSEILFAVIIEISNGYNIRTIRNAYKGGAAKVACAVSQANGYLCKAGSRQILLTVVVEISDCDAVSYAGSTRTADIGGVAKAA